MIHLYAASGSLVLPRPKIRVKLLTQSAENWISSESCISYLDLAFRISVVNSNTAQKGTFT